MDKHPKLAAMDMARRLFAAHKSNHGFVSAHDYNDVAAATGLHPFDLDAALYGPKGPPDGFPTSGIKGYN
jgi:hypothetical protein